MQDLKRHGVPVHIAAQLSDNARKLLALRLDAEVFNCPREPGKEPSVAVQRAVARRMKRLIREANGNRPFEPSKRQSKRQRLSADPYAYYAALPRPDPPATTEAAVDAPRPAAAAAIAVAVADAPASPAAAVAVEPPREPLRISNPDIKHSVPAPSTSRIRLKMSVYDLERYGCKGARERAAKRSVSALAKNALALQAQAVPAFAKAIFDAAAAEVFRKERPPAAAAAATAVVIDTEAPVEFQPVIEGKRDMEWQNADGLWSTTTEHTLALHFKAFPDDVQTYSPFFTCRGMPFDEQPKWLFGLQAEYGWCSSAGSAPVKRWSIRNAYEMADVFNVLFEPESLDAAYRAGWIVISD